jgi:transcriptional regulator NrdR family protein
MRCPRCDHDETYVLKTTTPENREVDSFKQRRRNCKNCQRPFMTFEIREADFDRLCALVMLEGPTRSPLKTRTDALEESDANTSKEKLR